MGVNRSSYRLTRELQPREREALALLGRCLPCKAIAVRMGVHPATVKVYLSHAYRSLGFEELPEYSPRLLAVRWMMARQLGLPLSAAATARARLFEELGLPPEGPEGPECTCAARSSRE